MRTRMEFINWFGLLAILTLGLAACNLPVSGPSSLVAPVSTATQISGQATSPSNGSLPSPVTSGTSTPVASVSTATQTSGQATSPSNGSLPTPDWASIANHILAFTPVPTPPSASGQNLPAISLYYRPIPLSGSEESFSAISSENFLWKGSPIPYDDLTLYTTNCSQPLKVDSFSVTITTNTATTFVYTWATMIITFNSDHTAVVSQQNVAVGNTLSISFNSASTQTVNQDVPFMLGCGTNYTIAFWIDFNGNSGPAGFNSVDLHILPMLPVRLPSPTPTPVFVHPPTLIRILPFATPTPTLIRLPLPIHILPLASPTPTRELIR